MIRAAVLAVFAAACASAHADVLYLKGGQRIEGEVQVKGGSYEVRTQSGTLVIPKSDVERLVPKVEVLAAKAEELHARGRALYEEAIKPDVKPADMNAKLKEGVELLRQSADIYQQARETYEGDAYAHIDKEILKLFQEMRIYRDKMVLEAGDAPKKPQPKPPQRETVAAERKAPGIPVNPPKPPALQGLDALKAAAEGGNVDAIIAVAFYYYVHEWDGKEATTWFKKAAKDRHPWSEYGLALLAIENRGERPNPEEARSRFINASNRGLNAAYVRLGMTHFYGLGVKRSMSRAEEACSKALPKIIFEAEAGDLEALTMLGWMYLEGMGVDQNREGGLACWRYAADGGYVPALVRLGQVYDLGTHAKPDWNEAAKWLGRAAEEGYAAAQHRYAYLHEQDFYRPNNPHLDRNKARTWYEKAMAQGLGEGIYQIGWYHMRGWAGLEKNPEMGIELLKKATQVAFGTTKLQALNDVGAITSNGDGVKKDEVEGKKWYSVAAKLGLPMSQYNMGINTGNPKEAAQWFLMAARQGYGHAAFKLGDAYMAGRGVPKSLDEAERWFEAALQMGWRGAEDALRILRAQRAKEQPPKR